MPTLPELEVYRFVCDFVLFMMWANTVGWMDGVDADSFPFLLPPFSLSCHYLPHRCCTHPLSFCVHYPSPIPLKSRSFSCERGRLIKSLEYHGSRTSSTTKKSQKLEGPNTVGFPDSPDLEGTRTTCRSGWIETAVADGHVRRQT